MCRGKLARYGNAIVQRRLVGRTQQSEHFAGVWSQNQWVLV
jgi:hypothetical protein